MKQKLIALSFAAALALATGVAFAPQAMATSTNNTNSTPLTCNVLDSSICSAANNKSDTKNTAIFALLKWVLRIMVGVVGIAAVGAFVFAGILYGSASGNAGQVEKAKTLMFNTNSTNNTNNTNNKTTTTTEPLTCNVLDSSICSAANNKSDTKNTAIFALLKWVLRIMVGVVGIAAVGAFVFAGILYGSASGNAGQVEKAKTLMFNTVIGLVAFGLMFIAINWLIPGGVLG